MSPRSRILMILSILLIAGCGRGSEAHDSETEGNRSYSTRGREAPPFGLETLEGDSLAMVDLAGSKVILMNFWASWCAPCRAEIPELIALHHEYRDQGLMVLGATVDDLPRDSRAFVQEMEIPYPSVITTPRMREEWKLAPWLPTTYLIVGGRIVDEWIGPQTREEFEYPIRVGLGLAPRLDEVTGTGSGDPRG